MGAVKIVQLKMTKEQLVGLGPAKSRLLLLCGHAINELMTLLRLVSMSGASEEADFVTQKVATGRGYVLLRILLGKVWECHELIRRRVLSHPEARLLLPELAEQARAALERCKRRLGQANSLAEVRDQHAFHYPGDQVIDSALQKLPDDDPLYFFLCDEHQDGTFYDASEVLFQSAVMSVHPGATAREQLEAQFNDAFEVTRDLSQVLTNLMAVIVADNWSEPDLEEMTVNAPALKTIRIPPFGSI